VTPNRKRDAQEMAATMIHSDIRGLGTALHLFLAGLPRSKSWDHHQDARIKRPEDSPHRSCASRYRFSVRLLDGCVLAGGLREQSDGGGGFSSRHFDPSSDVPDKGGELTGNRHAALVLSHFPARIQLAEPVCEAQLRFPGDLTDRLGLALLSRLDRAADAWMEAIVPGGLNENAPDVFAAGLGDGSSSQSVTRGEPRRDQSQILHQGFGVGKARDISKFCDNGDRGDEVDAPQTHQGLDDTFHAPQFALISKCLRKPFHTLVGVLDRLPIFVEGELLGGVFELASTRS